MIEEVVIYNIATKQIGIIKLIHIPFFCSKIIKLKLSVLSCVVAHNTGL